MLEALRTRARAARSDRGDADPILVLVTLGVLALVIAGIIGAVVHAQRWSTTYATDASEQSSEDAARLSWMGDVGTATAVVPAARPGTTARQSVRLDTTTPEPTWPAGATCRSVTWWLEDTTADPDQPNARDAAGKLRPVVAVHRDVAYYATTTGGTCTTSVAPVAKGMSTTPIRNALPGAQLTYVNGHLRDLVYPDPAHPSVEACANVPATDTTALSSCASKSQADIVPQRTAWEWADPEPVQVLLEMETDQAGAGDGYGTQIGWRETTGRRELVGDAASAVSDTLDNPPTPAKPAAPPTVTVTKAVDPTPGPAEDTVTITRTDTRALDGYEYQCEEYLNGTKQRVLGPEDMGVTNPAAALPVGGTQAGHEYRCSQRGWVNAVTPAQDAGQRFPGGVSPWSSTATVTRRPLAPTPAGVLNADNTATFTWPPVAGTVTYEYQTRVNATGTWTATISTTATTWTSPVLPADSRQYLRVRARNAGGISPWSTVNVARQFGAPTVTLPAGVVGQAEYTATWSHVTDFNPAVHTYEVQVRVNGDSWPTTPTSTQTTTGYTITGVAPGHTAHIRVRAVGVNAGTSPWSTVTSVTRPVAAPNAPGIALVATSTGVTSTPSGSVCEAGTTLQYAVWDSVRGWSGWGTPYRDHAVAEGSSISIAWQARCVPTAGAAVEGPEANTSYYRPYTAPATPTLYNPTDGYEGTNITFDWTSTGGYYQVVNGSGYTRTFTTSSALTILRESGSTCANVRAARTKAHADAGVWSGWSGTQCGATWVRATAPAAPGGVWAVSYGDTALHGGWNAVSGADYYEYRFDVWDDSAGGYQLGGVKTTTATSVTGYSSFGSGNNGFRITVRSRNEIGASAWRSATYGM